eukprot:752093-Hanusia_phi.AAC.1
MEGQKTPSSRKFFILGKTTLAPLARGQTRTTPMHGCRQSEDEEERCEGERSDDKEAGGGRGRVQGEKAVMLVVNDEEEATVGRRGRELAGPCGRQGRRWQQCLRTCRKG